MFHNRRNEQVPGRLLFFFVDALKNREKKQNMRKYPLKNTQNT